MSLFDTFSSLKTFASKEFKGNQQWFTISNEPSKLKQYNQRCMDLHNTDRTELIPGL